MIWSVDSYPWMSTLLADAGKTVAPSRDALDGLLVCGRCLDDARWFI
jgi:hypothetical protein